MIHLWPSEAFGAASRQADFAHLEARIRAVVVTVRMACERELAIPFVILAPIIGARGAVAAIPRKEANAGD